MRYLPRHRYLHLPHHRCAGHERLLARLDGVARTLTLIAAHAAALRAVLVTNNTREFSRIRGLKLQNWLRG